VRLAEKSLSLLLLAGMILLLSPLTFAQDLMPEAHSPTKQSDWGGSLSVASEIRSVQDTLGRESTLNFFDIAGGVRYRDWNFLLEYGVSETQQSGNMTLSVQSKTQDVLGWGYWTAPLEWAHLSPLLGGGVGVYQTKVTTTLSGVPTEDQSPWKLLGGASVGFKVNLPVVWLSLEGRLLFGDELDPQPTLTGLARLGLSF
jgi:hypothetical protein